MNRRDLLKCLAAGGAVVAGELWVPGRKLISIPSGRSFDDYILTIRGKNIFIKPDQLAHFLANEMDRVLAKYAHFGALN